MHYQLCLRGMLGGLALLLVALATAQQPNLAPKTAAEIIVDSSLWGKDFRLVLAYLEALDKAGVKTAEILPANLTTSQRYANARLATDNLSNLNNTLRRAQQQDLYKKVRRNFPFRARVVPAEVLQLPDSDSVAVGLNLGRVELLKPDLRIPDIEKRIGPAERRAYRTVNFEGDRLPFITTYHIYAKGAIVFVESNYVTPPRVLQRVYLDVPTIVNSLKNYLK